MPLSSRIRTARRRLLGSGEVPQLDVGLAESGPGVGDQGMIGAAAGGGDSKRTLEVNERALPVLALTLDVTEVVRRSCGRRVVLAEDPTAQIERLDQIALRVVPAFELFTRRSEAVVDGCHHRVVGTDRLLGHDMGFL